jgi:hypothetical protein
MDKPSERKKDSKAWGDTDTGIVEKTPGKEGKIERFDNMWHKPTTITGGAADKRLHENNYCKEYLDEKSKSKDSLSGLLDKVLNDSGGPPYCNISRPNRVL